MSLELEELVLLLLLYFVCLRKILDVLWLEAEKSENESDDDS
jgi:hypothetical protein